MTIGNSGRRRWLAATAAGLMPCLGPSQGRAWGARPAADTALLSAWAEGDQYFVGVVAAVDRRLQVRQRIVVPTRAHGVSALGDGTLIAVARRPGDWLLRWRLGRAPAEWHWAEPGRSFNGHAVPSADGRRLFTTETVADSGTSVVGVRDGETLVKLDEWPTHGIDAHALLVEGNTLLVANGGIVTRPETGRVKHDLHRMDSSLVRLGAAGGRLLAQWRLPDRRLSLRHLAANGSRIGVALQAEHDDATERAAAPVLAVLDDAGLRTVGDAPRLNGYGGDITPLGNGFAVSAPRAGRVAAWRPRDGWDEPLMLEEACALATAGHATLIGGQPLAARYRNGRTDTLALTGAQRLDNHWCVLDPRSG